MNHPLRINKFCRGRDGEVWLVGTGLDNVRKRLKHGSAQPPKLLTREVLDLAEFEQDLEGPELVVIHSPSGTTPGIETLQKIRAAGWHGPSILLVHDLNSAWVAEALDAGFRLVLELSTITADIFERVCAHAISGHRVETQLSRFAFTDPLTGLLNRRAFYDLLSNRLEQETRGPLHVFLIDVNDLKKHNDRFGHRSGDEVLRAVAKAIDSVLRKSDHAARIGGDEFAAFAENLNDEVATKISDRLDAALGEIKIEVPGDLRVSASVGVVSVAPGDYRPVDDIIHEADVRMFKHKRQIKGVNVGTALVRLPNGVFSQRFSGSFSLPRPL
jgi:diguanylate cyclase (GGDEF)-like protein